MKTKEELNALKEEVETVSRKLHELTEEELAQVSCGNSGVYGGSGTGIPKPDLSHQKKTYGLGSTDLKEFDGGSSYTSLKEFDGGSSYTSSILENAAENYETKLHQNYEDSLKQLEEEMNRKLQELMGTPTVFHTLLQ